jgi:hypothetical protein
METAWSQRIDTGAAYRRAGGRRHYNAVRQCRQACRRAEVVRLSRPVELNALAKALGFTAWKNFEDWSSKTVQGVGSSSVLCLTRTPKAIKKMIPALPRKA